MAERKRGSLGCLRGPVEKVEKGRREGEINRKKKRERERETRREEKRRNEQRSGENKTELRPSCGG
jgi:hypothetical protein